MPSVSAVIPNFNGGDCIINCIHALYSQTIPLETIIVIDSGSTDDSLGRIKAKFPEVQLLELGKDKGLSIARNAGLQLAKTDLVLLLDDDVYVAEDCLLHLLKVYIQNQPLVVVVCPRIVLIPDREIIQCDGAEAHFVGTMLLRHGYLSLKDAPAEAAYVGSCPGGCLLLDRKRVLAAHGFDEAYFFYFEDLEFSIRLRARGDKIICEPAAVVYHDRGSGTPGLSFRGHGIYPARRAYLTQRNRVMTMLIHYRIRTLIVLSPILILYEVATLTFFLTKRWAREWMQAFLWLLSNRRNLWQRRQLMQQSRRVNDRELLVGGPLPLAPGLITSAIMQKAVTTLSIILNAYWQVTKRWIG